jgi:hypothetical protein
MMRFLFIFLMLLGVIGATSAQTPFFPPNSDPVALADSAPHSATFKELAENRPLGFLLYDLTTDELLAGVNITQQLPVVSAIKGPILMFFLEFVPSDVWGSVPVEYWNAKRDAVPDVYLTAWDAHYDILNDIYRMIVYSDNYSTGDVLYYAYALSSYAENYNPIQAFNEWSYTTIGISLESGMREWDKGATENPSYTDNRFDQRTTLIYGVPRFFNNTFSVLDLARYYHWLYNTASDDIFETAKSVMSIVEGYPGFLELTALNLGGMPVSKDGFVGPGDENNDREEWLTADAGLMLFDDRDLLVVSMSVNGGDRTDELYGEVERIVRADRQELFWNPAYDFVSWMRSADSPYGENNLSTEALYFIADYLYEQGIVMEAGTEYSQHLAQFLFARDFWLTVFPDDVVPATRNEVQSRVMGIRYADVGGTLTEVAQSLGLIAP